MPTATASKPSAPQYVGELATMSGFYDLPIEQQLRHITELAPKDPHFMNLSGADRKAVIEQLLGRKIPTGEEEDAPATMEQAVSEKQVSIPPPPESIPDATAGAPLPWQAAAAALTQVVDPIFRSIVPITDAERADMIQRVTGAPPQRLLPTGEELRQLRQVVTGTQPEFNVGAGLQPSPATEPAPSAVSQAIDKASQVLAPRFVPYPKEGEPLGLLEGIRQNIVTDPVVTGVVRGAQMVPQILTTGGRLLDTGLSAVGLPAPSQYVTPEQYQARMGFGERPVETLLMGGTPDTGAKAFPEQESAVGRFIQNAITNTTGVMLTGGILNTVSQAARAVPITDQLIQGVGAGLVGQGLAEVAGGELNPWVRFATEFGAQLGIARLQSLLKTVQALQQQGMSSEEALRQGIRGTTSTEKALQEALAHPTEQQNLQQAIDVQQRYPEVPGAPGAAMPGVQMDIAEGAGSPSLLTAAETKLTDPQRLALLQRREQNQARIQREMDVTTGAGQVEGATEVLPVVETKTATALDPSTQALTSAEQAKAAVPTGPEAQALAQAEATKKAAGAPLLTARQQQLDARRAAVAAKARQAETEAAIEQTTLQNAQDLGLAQQKVQRELTRIAPGKAPDETDVSFFERLGQPIRQAYEKVRERWQQTARQRYGAVDPQDAMATPAGNLFPILDDIESKAAASFQADDAPRRLLRTIRQAIAERGERGGASRVTMDQEVVGRGNILGDLWEATRQAERERLGVPPLTTDDLAAVPLSLNDLRRIRSELLKESRSTTDSTARYYLSQLDDRLSSLMENIAPAEVLEEVKAINQWYRTEGLRFWEGPGAHILAKTPQGTFRTSNAKVIEELWSAGGIAKPETLRTVIAHVGSEPETMQAIRTFAEADLYDKVVKPGMSIARDGIDAVDTHALSQWLRRHKSQVQELPAEMQEPFRNVRSAYQSLREQERRGEVLLSQAKAPLAEVTAEAKAASLAQAEAAVRAQEAQGPFTAATQGAREAQKTLTATERAAEEAVTKAARAHEEAADAFAHSAVGRLTKDEHLHENFAKMMSEEIPIRTRYLNELYETVKGDPQAKQGLLRMIWNDFTKKQQATAGHVTEATRLANAVPLLDHRHVKKFLNDNERWLRIHYPDQFDNLTQITKDLAVAQRHMTAGRGALPTAIKPASNVERGIVDVGAALSMGVAVEVARHTVAGFLPPLASTMVGLGAGAGAHTWLNMRGDQKLRLLQEALVNEDAGRILSRMSNPATRPEWLRAALYNFFLRQGIVGQPSAEETP